MTTPTALGIALLIGALMGLLGGGGSIVAVPALTMLLGLEPKDAVVASLLVVGLAAVAGALSAWLRGVLPPAISAVVGLSAIVGASAGGVAGARLPDRVQLTILAIVMLLAAVVMWLRPSAPVTTRRSPDVRVLSVTGLCLGVLTGVAGVGGGFLAVPALVIAARLPMDQAGGVSLFVIALSAAAALPGYASHGHLSWSVMAPFAATTVAAVLAAGPLASRLPQRLLQQTFAITLVILGSYLLLRT